MSLAKKFANVKISNDFNIAIGYLFQNMNNALFRHRFHFKIERFGFDFFLNPFNFQRSDLNFNQLQKKLRKMINYRKINLF